MGHFDSNAMPKCFNRLDKAKESLFKCRNAHTFDEFLSHWGDFLLHTGGVIHALKAGASKTPQALQWYNVTIKQSKNDELLQYMFQSRNSHEHRTDAIAAYNPFPMIGKLNPDTKILEPAFIADGSTAKIQPNGWVSYDRLPEFEERRKDWHLGIGSVPTGPVLRAVRGKSALDIFPPPRRHKGKILIDDGPINVADLYVKFLEDIVHQAGLMC